MKIVALFVGANRDKDLDGIIIQYGWKRYRPTYLSSFVLSKLDRGQANSPSRRVNEDSLTRFQ